MEIERLLNICQICHLCISWISVISYKVHVFLGLLSCIELCIFLFHLVFC